MYDVLVTPRDPDTRVSILKEPGSVSIALADVMVYSVLITPINPETGLPIVVAGVAVYVALAKLRNPNTICSIAVAGVVVYDVIRGRIFGISLENNAGIQIIVAEVLAHSVVVTIEDDPPLIVIADVAGHYVGITLPQGYALTGTSTGIINYGEGARNPDKDAVVVVCAVITDDNTIGNIIKKDSTAVRVTCERTVADDEVSLSPVNKDTDTDLLPRQVKNVSSKRSIDV